MLTSLHLHKKSKEVCIKTRSPAASLLFTGRVTQPQLYYGLLVYVIGLHAVQFGNNWTRKIPRSAKLDEAVGRVQLGSPRNFLNPIISKLDKHVVLLPINYRASKNSLFKAKLNVRAKTIQFILNWTVCKN